MLVLALVGLVEQVVEYQMLLVVTVRLQVVLDFMLLVVEQEITDAIQRVMLEQAVVVLVLEQQAQAIHLHKVLLKLERQIQDTVVAVLVPAVDTLFLVEVVVKVLLL